MAPADVPPAAAAAAAADLPPAGVAAAPADLPPGPVTAAPADLPPAPTADLSPAPGTAAPGSLPPAVGVAPAGLADPEREPTAVPDRWPAVPRTSLSADMEPTVATAVARALNSKPPSNEGCHS